MSDLESNRISYYCGDTYGYNFFRDRDFRKVAKKYEEDFNYWFETLDLGLTKDHATIAASELEDSGHLFLIYNFPGGSINIHPKMCCVLEDGEFIAKIENLEELIKEFGVKMPYAFGEKDGVKSVEVGSYGNPFGLMKSQVEIPEHKHE